MKYHIIISMIIILFISEPHSAQFRSNEAAAGEFISSADLSSLPRIESTNEVFYDFDGRPEDPVAILEKRGVNTVRLRTWCDPVDEHSGFTEVKSFSDTLRSRNLKIWIALHYSDTWADPGHQAPPTTWRGISYNALKDSVYSYTARIVSAIQPDFIQIGNEINSGLLFPYGDIGTNEAQFIELISEGVRAVRENSDDARIIIHFAGIDGSDWFFGKLSGIDYDIIGISYYPIWHGKDLSRLQSTLSSLSGTYKKDIVIAETAYPFTLKWNDWTNNIVGLEEQLILPEYPATPKGQKDFISKIKEIILSTDRGIGFCYWGGELVAFEGARATDGSPWENQALFDFNNEALPVISEFKDP